MKRSFKELNLKDLPLLSQYLKKKKNQKNKKPLFAKFLGCIASFTHPGVMK